jgi:hypothetical protein
MERDAEVTLLGEKVAYSWTCNYEGEHEHNIHCLWIWHNCDLNVRPIDQRDPNADHWTLLYVGWKPAGVGLHDLISVDPLHIEASVFWPSCCGMHGFIRDGKWIDV